MKFYGRTDEINALKHYEALSSESAQMIVVSGRRRIGKTTLIKEAFKNTPFVYFFVGKKSESLLCEELSQVVRDKLGEDLGDFFSIKRLFLALMKISSRINFTLVFDEFQNFKYVGEGIFSDFQDVWDEYKNGSRINLVICGSVYSKMKKIFEDKDEPLYGRATARLKVAPFTLATLKSILSDHNPKYTNEDLLALYMITGGVAKYVELLMEQKAFSRQDMIDSVLSLGSYFIDEGKELLSDEFGKDYGNYFSVLAALASGRTSRGSMTSYTGFETGGYLERLESDYGVVAKIRPYMSGENVRNVRYAMSDNFLTFWFRFIYKYRSAIEIGNMDYVKSRISEDYESFSGHILERYFRQQYKESGEYNLVTNYWEKGSGGEPGEKNEIDLIAVNDNIRQIVIGECKRNPNKFDKKDLELKSAKIVSHHKKWKISYIGLSLADM